MKITCQSCQAKYTIADEKVAGKTVKIKCKKCGATIVVNGSETGGVGPIAAPAPPAAAAAPAGDDEENEGSTRVFAEGSGPGGSEWTVNVTDEDQRTLTSTQLVIEYKRGVVTADTYVWKDGMADWAPVSNVPELMTLINSVSSAAPAPAAGMPAAPAPMPDMPPGGLGGTMMMNEGPAPSPLAAAAAAPTATPAPAAARRKAPAGGVDLFAPGQQPDGGGAASASSATTSADRLVGERNENSVLFSISALTASAGASKRGDDPFDLGPAPGRNGGRGGGASVDDIMNLGGGGMSQGPVLAPPPLLAPVVEAPPPPAPVIAMQPMNMGMGMQEYPQKKKAPIGLIVGLVVGALGLGGGAFFALNSGGGEKKTDETANTAATTATTAPAATTAAPAPTQAAAADTGAVAQPASTGSPTATPTQGPVAAANPGKADPKPGPGGHAEPKPEPKPDPKADAKPDPKPDPKPDAKADDKKPAPDTGGGKEFDRSAAQSALGAAAGGARSCKTADGPTGSGRVKVTWAPSGNVTSVTLESGPFQGTPLAGCIIGAFRGARVPAFDGAPVSAPKSFSIN